MNDRMTCREGVAALKDYFDGMLTPARRAAIDTHVAGCPRCTAFVRAYRDTPRILRTATAAKLPRSAAAALRRFLAHNTSTPVRIR
jgi:anti-sigma factor RsiW